MIGIPKISLKESPMHRMLRYLFALFLFSHACLSALTNAYVLSTNYVSVIDTATDTLTATIHLPTASSFYGMVITPDGKTVYTFDTIGNAYVINTSTNAIAKTITGLDMGGNFPAITPDGSKIYITCTNAVDCIDVASNTLQAKIPLNGAGQLVITPDSSLVYVTNPTGGTVRFIHTANNALDPTFIAAASGILAGGPITLTADGRTLYVNDGSTLRAISTASNTVVASYALGTSQARGMGVTADGKKVYIGRTFPSGAIDLVDILNNTVTAITTPVYSYFITMSPDTSVVFSGGTTTNTIPMIQTTVSPTTANIINVLTPVEEPGAILANNKKAYFPSVSSATVVVVDIPNQTLAKTINIAEATATKIVLTPFSLSSVTGGRVKHHFGLVIHLYNQISWTAPTTLSGITASYEIYRDGGLTQLAGTVPADTLTFVDYNRKEGESYNYYIVAVSTTGSRCPIGQTTVTP